jgi:phage baseplate assembly protein V
MYDIEQRVIELEARLNQLVRVGTVESVNVDDGTVRVSMADADGIISYSLPVLVPKSQDDKYYAMPDVGEQVLCLFLPLGLSQGFVLGAFFSGADTVPVASKDKTHILFKDGTSLEYDRAAHKLTGSVAGDVELTATGQVAVSAGTMVDVKGGTVVQIAAPLVKITGQTQITGAISASGGSSFSGDLAVSGSISATGSITDTGGNTNHHTH